MTNPVLVEVTRGNLIESRHRGAIAVIDGDGNSVLSIGDVETPVFPRSAVKALQALALVETGAADHFGLDPHELALACSSHSAEAEHINTASSILAKIGLDKTALECGPHRPVNEAASLALAEAGQQPHSIHNNCSGKHSGFLCLACHLGIEHTGYIGREHPLQVEIRAVLQHMTGAAHGVDNCGIDGCSVPTYAVPLTALAHGFARFVTGTGLEAERAKAAKRLYDACTQNPWYVAGTDRACTKIMQAGKTRIFTKTGAEGVYCAAIPELGIGIAIKADDGAKRASEAMICEVIAKMLPGDDKLASEIRSIGLQTLENCNNMEVGKILIRDF